MKITIKNKEVSDFHTLVMYSNLYLPGYEDYSNSGGRDEESVYIVKAIKLISNPQKVGRSSRVLYKYSSSKINDSGFTEYDFKFFPDKYKYNDTPKLELLQESDKELIGPSYRDLYGLEESLFPAYIDSEEEENIGYFSSYMKGSQEVYVFNIPSGVTRVELYGSSLTRNIKGDYYTGLNDQGQSVGIPVPEYSFVDCVEFLENLEINRGKTISPDVLIEFGPDFDSEYNPKTWYYSEINWNIERKEIDINDWINLRDERLQNKTLYFSVTRQISSSMNLSYSAWLESVNPNRNKHEYSLRNDEFGQSVSPVSRDSLGFVYDETSGTLVGSKSGIVSPLLERRISSDKWNKKCKYWKGDIVEVGEGMRFMSLINDNIGNHPCTSGKWIVPDFLEENILLDLVKVVVPMISGVIPGGVTPKGTISILKGEDDFRKEFYYTVNPGYQLSYLSSRLGEQDMNEPNDYDRQTVLNNDGTISYRAIVKNWIPLIQSGYLYFNYATKKGKLKVMVGIISEILTPEMSNLSGGYDFDMLVRNYNIEWVNLPIEQVIELQGITTKETPESSEVPYDENEGVDLGCQVLIRFSWTVGTDINPQRYKVSSFGVIYQSSNDLISSSEGITIVEEEEDPSHLLMTDEDFHYPTSYSGNDLLYPQYSVILSIAYYKLVYLTSSDNIQYKDNIQYQTYNGQYSSNRFVYTGRKTSLHVLAEIISTQDKDSEGDIENVNTEGSGIALLDEYIQISYDSTTQDYEIRVNRMFSQVQIVKIIIEE